MVVARSTAEVSFLLPYYLGRSGTIKFLLAGLFLRMVAPFAFNQSNIFLL
jgi:hypothetical protein